MMSFSACQSQRQQKTNLNKQLKASWSEEAISLNNVSKAARFEVKGKKADYEVPTRFGGPMVISVTAFASPESDQAWAGPAQDFYAEIPSGIVGGRILLGGHLLWTDSLVPKKPSARSGTEDVIERLDKEVDGSKLVDAHTGGFGPSRMKRLTPLQSVLKPEFFGETPFSMRTGQISVLAAEVDKGNLRLDLASPTGVFKASVWIDLKKRSIVRAVEDGKEVFPTGKQL
jgi:hypothetical protein